jgi:hypothetical protein
MDSQTGERAQAGTPVPHDGYRTVAVPADSPTKARDTGAVATADILPAVAIARLRQYRTLRLPSRDSRAACNRHPRLLAARDRAARLFIPRGRMTAKATVGED